MPSRVLPGPLVDVDWLASNLDRVSVVDVRSYMDGRSGRDAYAAGHIPGAGFAHLDEDLSAPIGETGGRHPLPDPADFASVMSRLGIDNDTAVVAYDDAGGTIAARLWWMLDNQGVDVAVLDGGIPAWTGELSTQPSTPDPAAFTARPWADGSTLSADQVAERTGTDTIILDARSGARFAGEPFHVDARYGHIPSAHSAPATANIDPDTGRFETVDQSRERYAAVGALDAGEVVAYCGSGVTACADLLALRRLGVHARLYVGSWSEWGADTSRPIE